MLLETKRNPNKVPTSNPIRPKIDSSAHLGGRVLAQGVPRCLATGVLHRWCLVELLFSLQ
jgi:hypothetical protein